MGKDKTKKHKKKDEQKKTEDVPKKTDDEPEKPDDEPKNKEKKKEKISKSKRAGLVFPVGRVSRHLRQRAPKFRISQTAPVYMASILEYLVAELVEICSDVCKAYDKKRITPVYISRAISADAEFKRLCGDCYIINSDWINPDLEFIRTNNTNSGDEDDKLYWANNSVEKIRRIEELKKRDALLKSRIIEFGEKTIKGK